MDLGLILMDICINNVCTENKKTKTPVNFSQNNQNVVVEDVSNRNGQL